ncbi:Gfo/Idh/MocA family oxidoreductase [Streptacidiphilus sp. ASG 303]|uniref:Gfo/Idh/MocA family protein n=1 Tax=Streptacidiphilus sp. ASG 303 TaxID=2896847 RepID=UPI001E5B050E|nr:Gfo/Idh/MocA family oxidoreductase [Streptacidiphilus sp. ASG 303]MCD0481756.1 Gfo/Idh/MocA family oxidoreductase [Streptacidiphilus sp. ASG 303]
MRFGLLGTGPWATAVHAPVLAAHPGVEFAGVWGRRPEAAAELAGRFGARPYDDPGALLAEVDAVAVALPPDVQSRLAVRAAAAGCHLLLDKPLALAPEAARQVADAAAATSAASVVFFTTRFEARQAAWIAEQAAVGGWSTGRADWLGAVFTTGSPFAASPWRRERGALWDVGPHALSVLLPVLGDVAAVTAVRGAGDTVHLVCRHRSGASSTAALSLTVPSAAAGTAVELRGESGTAVLPAGGDGAAAALHRAVDALREAAATGTPHACDAGFGLRVVEVLAAAERSLATGATAAL